MERHALPGPYAGAFGGGAEGGLLEKDAGEPAAVGHGRVGELDHPELGAVLEPHRTIVRAPDRLSPGGGGHEDREQRA